MDPNTYSYSFESSSILPGWLIGLGAAGIALLIVVFALIILFKGYSLWNAAKRDEKWWFVILLVVNTVGILELIYLLAIAKRNPFTNKPLRSASSSPEAFNSPSNPASTI